MKNTASVQRIITFITLNYSKIAIKHTPKFKSVEEIFEK